MTDIYWAGGRAGAQAGYFYCYSSSRDVGSSAVLETNALVVVCWPTNNVAVWPHRETSFSPGNRRCYIITGDHHSNTKTYCTQQKYQSVLHTKYEYVSQ